jgi:hypothetical protein
MFMTRAMKKAKYRPDRPPRACPMSNRSTVRPASKIKVLNVLPDIFFSSFSQSNL